MSLRIPNSIHSRVKNLAEYDGVSVNQFITVAITEKLSVMNAAEYFSEKASKGSRDKFDQVLSKVSKREPLEYDKK
ncbi:MAG: toxin-antitoxin system HicB family antitoxin [Chitinispirillaceae bacterium]|nr:toxin-antitoxin system HicB family antitoxin [Chitinispirillaceae bacterium]